MPIFNNLNFSGSDLYLRAAMSGLAARQRTIANNVANIDTPNFKASEVRFEETLAKAIGTSVRGATPDQTTLNGSTSRATLVDSTSAKADGNNVDIDREM
jgi:flagellar basal-body rod protein FlgB